MNCWVKGDGSSKRVSYNHLMAGYDVQARPMIIKATESQPLPSEAFIVTREWSREWIKYPDHSF